MNIRNIIFDVDGTLVDSKRDIARAVLWVLHQFGVNHTTEEDIYPRIGRPLSEQLKEFFPPELHARIPEAVELYIGYYRPRELATTTLFPGVLETLQRLQRAGINLAVATTKSTHTTLNVLTHFGIDKFFVQMQGTDGTPPKPDPFVIQTILDRQQWQRHETMMVGDTDVDVAAGKSAGVWTCAVTYGAFPRHSIVQSSPDFVVDSPAEVPSIVERND